MSQRHFFADILSQSSNGEMFIDVPRPLTNDIWVFLFQTIDAECVKSASLDGTYVYVKAFIINENA